MYDPYSGAHGDRQDWNVPTRARVYQKGGERSFTYSHPKGGGNG